jgi:hypothetical protein
MRSATIPTTRCSPPFPARPRAPKSEYKKRPELRLKQGAFALVSEHGLVLKRGHDLSGVMAPLERRLMRLVG